MGSAHALMKSWTAPGDFWHREAYPVLEARDVTIAVIIVDTISTREISGIHNNSMQAFNELTYARS